MKKFKYFVGIDISKHKLDVVLLKSNLFTASYILTNEVKEIAAFLKMLKALPGVTIKNTVFCMEQTGIYSNHLLNVLGKAGANIVLENAYHIKQSLGLIREKTDKLDATRIAHYLYRNREDIKLWTPRREIISQLKYLSSLRWGLVAAKNALKNPIREGEIFFDKKMKAFQANYANPSVLALDQEIVRIERAIGKIVASDQRIQEIFRLITSVPAIGPVTALEIIISSNEFISISDPRKFACYAGLIPFRRESGTVTMKRRVSTLANKRIKSLLTICAFTAIRSIPDIKAYYQRKTQGTGKAKMSVINAVRNKLVLRIYACIREERVYQKNILIEETAGTLNKDGS